MTDGQTQTAALSYSVDTNAAGGPVTGADDSNADTATQALVSATNDASADAANADAPSNAGAESTDAAPADGSPRLLAMVTSVNTTATTTGGYVVPAGTKNL